MEIKDNYIYFEPHELKYKKKISARTFAGLCHFDKFNTPEEYLLEHHGLLEPEEIDKRYKLRGDFAEKIVKKVYERDNKVIISYDAEACKYDCFPNVKDWGGVPDIEVPMKNFIVEVKSKSMSHYDYISKFPLASEYYQGLFYAYLKGYPKVIMEWIFFDAETEQEIMNGKKPTTLKNLKRVTKEYEVDRPHIKGLLDTALDWVQTFRENRRISLHCISPRTLQRVITKFKKFEKPKSVSKSTDS